VTDRTQREGDELGCQEFKKRRVAMAGDHPSVMVNGALARARVISALIRDLTNAGVAAVVLFVIIGAGIAFWAGWLPNPLLTKLDQYNEVHTAILEEMKLLNTQTQTLNLRIDAELAAMRHQRTGR